MEHCKTKKVECVELERWKARGIPTAQWQCVYNQLQR